MNVLIASCLAASAAAIALASYLRRGEEGDGRAPVRVTADQLRRRRS